MLDFIVIATYLAPVDLRFLRIFRLTRLLRVLNLEAFDRSLQSIYHAIGRRKHLLVVSAAAMLTVAYCFAALLWWSIRFSPTGSAAFRDPLVGGGDPDHHCIGTRPPTSLGKVLSGAIVLVGIGVFALPSAIVTASHSRSRCRQANPFAPLWPAPRW